MRLPTFMIFFFVMGSMESVIIYQMQGRYYAWETCDYWKEFIDINGRTVIYL